MLYRLTGGKVVTKGRDLPQGSVDRIVRAMEDQEMWQQERCQPWHRAAVAWAEARRTPVLAIDPPPALPARMAVVGGLPLSHDSCRPAGGSGGSGALPTTGVCSVQCAVCSVQCAVDARLPSR